MSNNPSAYEEGLKDGKDEGITNTVLYFFGLTIGQLNGLGFGREELKAQLDKCMDMLENHDAEAEAAKAAKAVRLVVKKMRDNEQ